MSMVGKIYDLAGRLVLFIALAGGFCSSTLAADIDSVQSRTIAADFFIQKYGIPAASTASLKLLSQPIFHDTLNQREDIAFYVWQLDQVGYVAVSAWNFSREILFYSAGDFRSNQEVEGFQYWFDHYVQNMLEKHTLDLPAAGKKSAASVSHIEALPGAVDPLITTTWNQGCYYNELCPVDLDGPCDRALAGCVAVALAQILNYHQYPVVGTGSNSYIHDVYGLLEADFTGGYDYSLYPASLSASNPDLARFIYHCGVAVNMDYGPGTSGAASQVDAFIKYFNYSETLAYIYRRNFSEADWSQKLKENLARNRPVYYVGRNETDGHAFVCDGYDELGLFHFNLGWGGAADGYYSLDDLEYGINQSAFVNISPPYTGPTLEQDSLALVALYMATSGENWKMQENWLTGNVSEWFGVEVDKGRVSTLVLADNLLDGFIPVELWNLEGLKTLNLRDNQLRGQLAAELGSLIHMEQLFLSHNQLDGGVPQSLNELGSLRNLYLNHNEFSSFPVLGSLPYLERLYLFNNSLEFDDIEPNIGKAGNFLYSSQSTLGNEKEKLLYKGEDHQLEVSCGGEHNLYQWYRNNQPVENAMGAVHFLSELDQSDAGVYHCEINNSLATKLTLVSAPEIVSVSLPADWVAHASDYSDSCQLIAELKINDQKVTTGWLAAFNADVAMGSVALSYSEETGQSLFYLSCFSHDDAGKEYSFKYYNPGADSIYLIEESLFLVPGTSTGTPHEPVWLNNKNHPPLLILPVPDQEFSEYFASRTIDLSGVFEDPEGGPFTLSASSSHPSVVTVQLNDERLLLKEAGLGSSLISLTATDQGNSILQAQHSFSVTVVNVNDAPYVIEPIPDHDFERGFGSTRLDLSMVFADRDGDELQLIPVSSDPAVITVSMEDSILILTETGPGSTQIIITASDEKLLVEEHFNASVSYGVSIENHLAFNGGALIYPNPSTGYFIMELHSAFEEESIIEIYSSAGVMILQKVAEQHPSLIRSTFDLSEHPPGIYYMKLRNNLLTVISRVVIY